ncbi:MAG TPA: ADOP family duplicated permease [Gemmatimonadaceae bacterium]|nr:ADOP family duplicated permease [Gemmatimonadaceae bacterium]
MSTLNGLLVRARGMLRRRGADAELDAEVRFHIDMETERNVRAGLPPAEARRVALARFGGVQQVREEHRDGRRIGWLEDTLADARFAARALSRTPGVTVAIVLTLALGLGANAAIFSVLDRIFFRMPAGVAAPESVLRLYEVPEHPNPVLPALPLYGYPKYASIRAAIGDAAQVTTYAPTSRARLDDGEPQAFSSFVGAGFFSLLGVRPALGRFFAPDEERLTNPSDVVVLSYDYWQNRFGGDHAVLGRQLRIDDRPYTIIGVAQQGFAGVDLDVTDFWRPLSSFRLPSASGSEPTWYQQHNMYFLNILIRPAREASASAVAARATAGLRRDARLAPSDDSLATAVTGSLIASRGPAKPRREFALSVLIAGVALIVLLIACANVANLLLARATRRRPEVALRLAMGISRGRLVRMLLTESVLLAVLAGAAAYVAAVWSGGLLRGVLLPDAHWQAEVHGARLVAFTIGAALFAACATALVPAFQSARTDLTIALKSGAREGGGHRSRLRTLLVIAQSAAAALLVIGAGLFVRSLHNITSQRLGYDVDRLALVTPAVPKGLSGTPAEAAAARELAARLAPMPSIERTALVRHPTPGTSVLQGPFRENGDTLVHHGQLSPGVSAVSASFFSTVGMRVLLGRIFGPSVGESAPAEVVINNAMARAYWPGTNPVGQCIRFDKQPASPCYTIVGIVETARLAQSSERGGDQMELLEKPQPEYYLPIDAPAVRQFGASWIVVRVAPGHIADVGPAVRPLIARRADGSEGRVLIMSDMLAPQLHAWRLGAWLFTALALLALIVAAMGVFSTLMYTTVQRTHEIGVRMALGARRSDVARVVIRSGVVLAGAGVVLGVVLAIAFGRVVASLLYGVTPHDPATIAGAGAVLVVVSVIAAAVPAWRATRVDPVVALRAEA